MGPNNMTTGAAVTTAPNSRLAGPATTLAGPETHLGAGGLASGSTLGAGILPPPGTTSGDPLTIGRSALPTTVGMASLGGPLGGGPPFDPGLAENMLKINPAATTTATAVSVGSMSGGVAVTSGNAAIRYDHYSKKWPYSD